ILSQVDSQGLRLVYVTDDGYHPSDYYHSTLQKMPDAHRPWRYLEWIRIIDYYHACQYAQQLADVIFGPGAESQNWAKRMRKQLNTQREGGQVILDLRVVWLSGVWDAGHQRFLASKPLPVIPVASLRQRGRRLRPL